LRFVERDWNEHELPRLPQFAAENQFDTLTIRTLVIIDAPTDSHFNFIPSDERYRAYDYENNQRISRTDFICEKVFISSAVFVDGTVVACDQDYNAQQPYGRLTDHKSFAEIWRSRQAVEIRRTIRDEPENFSFCRNCPFRDRAVGPTNAEYYELRR
jgi:radical SAM protein with 4Fe4S-binding SPASM domain